MLNGQFHTPLAEIVHHVGVGYQIHGISTRRGCLHELSGVVRHIHIYTAASFSLHVCVDCALEDINIMYMRTIVCFDILL